jgi:hypothetical protein
MWPVLLGASLLFVALADGGGQQQGHGPYPNYQAFRDAIFATNDPDEIRAILASIGVRPEAATIDHPWMEILLDGEDADAYADHVMAMVTQAELVPPEVLDAIMSDLPPEFQWDSPFDRD